MSQDDYDYTGGGKEFGSGQTIIFWYCNPEMQLRADFNDFKCSWISEADQSVQ